MAFQRSLFYRDRKAKEQRYTGLTGGELGVKNTVEAILFHWVSLLGRIRYGVRDSVHVGFGAWLVKRRNQTYELGYGFRAHNRRTLEGDLPVDVLV